MSISSHTPPIRLKTTSQVLFTLISGNHKSAHFRVLLSEYSLAQKRKFWLRNMCLAWEEEHSRNEVYLQHNRNGRDILQARLDDRIRVLEARMANVEARMGRLEKRMLYLQLGMRLLCSLFLVTLLYAIFK